MKNYYEILEVNKKASAEVIEKAYKTLVKKYHPDLQETPEAKQKSEVKIKEINEAYEVLGDAAKREEFDRTIAKEEAIENERIMQEKIEREFRNQAQANKNYNYTNNNNYNYTEDSYNKRNYNNNYNNDSYNNNSNEQKTNNGRTNKENNINEQFIKDYEDTLNKAYHDAYIQDMKNRGYRIRYKKSWHERLRSLIAILITIGIILLILQLPFVKDYFNSLYKDNEAFRNIADFFSGLFK